MKRVEIEIVLRFKSKGVVFTEWAIRDGDVECIEYFPSGRVDKITPISLQALNRALA